jgi:surface protein
MIENSICELQYFLKKIFNYEEALYYIIKSLIFYKFKNNKELKTAVDLYIPYEYDNNMFNLNKALRIYGHISLWDTSLITNIHGLFIDKFQFNENINDWDVSNVTNMNSIFSYCYSFNQPLDKWDVSNVQDMFGVFFYCTNFNQPLNSWNVSNVIILEQLFCECEKFNQPLNSWNIENVQYIGSMFCNCESFNQDLSVWDLGQIKDKYKRWTFKKCQLLQKEFYPKNY